MSVFFGKFSIYVFASVLVHMCVCVYVCMCVFIWCYVSLMLSENVDNMECEVV